MEVDQPFLSGHPDFGGNAYGIAVNTFPSSPFFGRTYLANWGTNPGIGVYIENADGSFQGVASGTAEGPGFQAPFNAGIPYAGADGPYHLQVGSDGYLYVSDWSDGSGGIYREQEAPVVGTGATVTGGLINGENVLAGYGEPNVETTGNHDDVDSAVIISGSTATGNLLVYADDTHYGASNNMGNQPYVWNVGGTTLTPVAANNTSLANLVDGYTGAPTPFVNQSATFLGLDTRFFSPASLTTIGPGDQMTMFPGIAGVITNLARGGPANQFYVTQSRSNSQQPGLFVVSPANDGLVEWDSLDETMRQQLTANFGVDYILDAVSVQTSPDGRFIAVGQGSGAVYLTPFNGQAANTSADFGFEVTPLLAGIPDLKLLQVVATAHGSNYQVAFDAADNIYTVNATTANQQVWGPGGSTTTITGTNGTFSNSSQWNANANGTLSNTSNWLGGVLLNGNDQAITFGAITTAQRTVSVDSSETVGAITFSSPNGYTLSAGGGALIINGFGANFTANAGNNTIAAPTSINTDVGFYAAAGASLTISGPVTFGNVALFSATAMPNVVKSGAGTVSVSNLNLVHSDLGDPGSGNLDIYQGKLQLLANSGPAVISELTLLNQYGASLDLTNNSLIYDYNLNAYTTASPIGVVEGLVASGGIFTSVGGVKAGTGLAVVENNSTYLGANTFSGSFDGQSINAESSTGGAILVKYTYFGDLNLDGKVDGTDFTLMGSGLTGWGGGDLNYATDASGKYDVVNADDWSLFELGAAEYGAGHVQLPEPAAVALLGLAAIPMIRRRRA
jgi:MYXO-CTERM domain-containing protein